MNLINMMFHAVFRIWDIESGTSVASFGNPSIVSLCDFKYCFIFFYFIFNHHIIFFSYVVNLYSSIIARKYVIGFSNEGFFKVWDLNTMIQKDKASNASIALGISSLWSYRMPKFLTLEKILVDEYQLYVYGRTKFVWKRFVLKKPNRSNSLIVLLF